MTQHAPFESIGFIGAGNMAEAIMRGLLGAGLVRPSGVILSDPSAERLARLATQYELSSAQTTDDNRRVLESAGVIVLAVKPQKFAEVAEQIAAGIQPRHLIVSILAGTRIATIESALAHAGCPHPRVMRVMPNTPALVLEGASAIAPGRHATPLDSETTARIFDAVGISRVVEEHHLDAITGLTGSGPAYLFRMIEGLLDAARAQGLPGEAADVLVRQMVFGAAKLAKESGEDPAELRRRVTSPGGTTAAGLAVLEDRGFHDSVVKAVDAATKRSRELAGDQAL